jgi:UDPglucose 6-dehydrogenase
MKVTVIGGAGYVGLVTAVGLARIGHHVFGVDINTQVVEQLMEGKISIHEDGPGNILEASACKHSSSVHYRDRRGYFSG